MTAVSTETQNSAYRPFQKTGRGPQGSRPDLFWPCWYTGIPYVTTVEINLIILFCSPHGHRNAKEWDRNNSPIDITMESSTTGQAGGYMTDVLRNPRTNRRNDYLDVIVR